MLGTHLHAPVRLPTTGCFPRNMDGFKTPNSLSLSTPMGVSKKLGKFFVVYSPVAWRWLPFPASRIAPSLQKNEHVFVCPGTLRFLLQMQICRVLQITVFFLRLPLQDHFSLTSTSLLLILYSYLLLVLVPIMHCELIQDVNDTFCCAGPGIIGSSSGISAL